jgi:two-component system alkaline phosphatase synthesis response regulator PhoP
MMAKKKILVIDDDQTILEMMDIALRKADFEVLRASDGDIGLRTFKKEMPDLLIVDIAMPGIDGYQVIEQIREAEKSGKKVPVVVLTAHEQPVMRDYAEELGADLYLVKPIKPLELVEKIVKLLE